MGNTYTLPKGKENDQFDADNLQKGFMLGQVHLKLKIELDQAIHGH